MTGPVPRPWPLVADGDLENAVTALLATHCPDPATLAQMRSELSPCSTVNQLRLIHAFLSARPDLEPGRGGVVH
jgi:hypothetical protein